MSLPELVSNYECSRQKTERIALTDLSDDTHREALAVAFDKGSIQGYSNLIEALKHGYASVGYGRGRNTLVSLTKWLVSRNLIAKHDKTYSLVQGIYEENRHQPARQGLFEKKPVIETTIKND